ncbi:PREDICTED: uncharacterized protein LOC108556373 [Nicrophorus vespilloides]|uniref:Uncharacterized protein LOC108556373 n=1 Tax=Nicrophorus vespilloides TaxID=110193 RepID=A0ABM1M042_NICVS|nr:PREDICTED: uncharacterized protein LOC108556373 [Nicrophorus vespilloides]
MNFFAKKVVMDQEKCEDFIKTILAPCHYQISIYQLDDEFEELTGIGIPFSYFGYTTLRAFLKSMEMLKISEYDCVKLVDTKKPETRRDNNQNNEEVTVLKLTQTNVLFVQNYEKMIKPYETKDSKMWKWLDEVDKHEFEQPRNDEKFNGIFKVFKKLIRRNSRV